MIEIFGLVFGGISRLGQHWMELKDKEKERNHEAIMFTKQTELADKRFVHDAELRRMDADADEAQAEWAGMLVAVKAQASEAKSAGGWVAKLSASVRPIVTYWLLLIYSAVKASMLYTALLANVPVADAIIALYSPADAALLSSILSFWFMDRSLRKR